ncbi:MAG: formate-dependent phosphoribosylglycinamide formyltransferase [Bdellovibrionales bacterium]|nr:formate-dependent phosphoribosylglycinamide formyltransferase [Bdellovibrionales bacterium]
MTGFVSLLQVKANLKREWVLKAVETIMILGSGELGKEVAISAQRLGQKVIAVDNYENAPAMQVADAFEVIDMLNGDELARIVEKHQPDILVPEVEAIRTTKLKDFEKSGIQVVPTAKATHITMNRDVVRDLASQKLKLKTAKYEYAESFDQLTSACSRIGFPCVIKPIMSSSGKGQSIVKKSSELQKAWDYAIKGARGDSHKIIVEEFIKFHLEITLLTVKQKKGPTLFIDPIGHRQEHGDYRESWMPAALTHHQLRRAKQMAKKITDDLGGTGVFGVEFFITKNDVYFSELSPRPHDTGMVTLTSQDLSQFDLHVRAILGLPIPKINTYGPSASAVILSKKEPQPVKGYSGLKNAMAIKNVDLRIFGKEMHRKNRRMGIALAKATSVKAAVRIAKKAASYIVVK